MSLPVARDAFAVIQGETITRDLPGGSGALLTQHFCEHCLVRTHTEPHASPTLTYVRPGTLDDTSWLRPVAQIWTSSGQRWACVEGILSFEGNPPDPTELVRAYRR